MEKTVEVKHKVQERPKRKPVGSRNRLSFVNLDPSRSYRIIDMEPARMAQFEEAGYRVENIKDYVQGGQRVDVPTPTDNAISVGGTKKQVLVSIEKEYYEEDQALKQRDGPDAKEAGIKANPSEGQYGEVKGSLGDM